MTTKEIAYGNYKKEAEEQFLKVFLDGSPKIKERIIEALTVVLNLDAEPVSKGLMLYSKSYGQGKTLFFEIVYNRVFRKQNLKMWKATTAKELREIYVKEGQEGLKNFISCKNLFIDDLGDEEEKTKHYGDDMNVLKYVILKRYEMWLDKEYLTHLTTNLSMQEIAERYDGRVADRLLQMTEKVEFDFIEGSYRQIKSTRRLTESEKKKKVIRSKEKTHDEAEYYKFLNEEAEEFRQGTQTEKSWVDYWIMYEFFLRKGLKMRKPTEEDREKAKAIIRAENTKENLKLSLLQAKANTHNKSPLRYDNAILSIIGKEYFIKLAKRKFAFNETNNLSEL